MSKGPKPQMLTQGPAMSWPIQGCVPYAAMLQHLPVTLEGIKQAKNDLRFSISINKVPGRVGGGGRSVCHVCSRCDLLHFSTESLRKTQVEKNIPVNRRGVYLDWACQPSHPIRSSTDSFSSCGGSADPSLTLTLQRRLSGSFHTSAEAGLLLQDQTEGSSSSVRDQ